jgi:hypothetical protein
MAIAIPLWESTAGGGTQDIDLHDKKEARITGFWNV